MPTMNPPRVSTAGMRGIRPVTALASERREHIVEFRQRQAAAPTAI
jgi:hypothetical protein